jgi:hypothetical protein
VAGRSSEKGAPTKPLSASGHSRTASLEQMTRFSSDSGSPFGHALPPTVSTDGHGTHQFRARNGLIKTQRTRSNSNENVAKSTKLTDILPLITVWLQVRVLPGPPKKSDAYQIQFRVTTPATPPFVAHGHTSAACKLTLDVRFDHGLSFSIVHPAVLSAETDGLYCVPASSYGSATVVDASETATPM